MAAYSLLVDPYADTLELPIIGRRAAASRGWERDALDTHLAGAFQVVRELGRGGMGVVFLSRDIALHRLVAIKVLRRELAGSEEHRERFRREARMTACLSHPHIVPVHTFCESDDFVCIVMKYVHGESLAERLRRVVRLDASDAAAILRDLAAALDTAHRQGVVHRDLKAENVLLERDTGRAMLTDFGVALLRSLDPVRADAARAFGTPHAMSPEQAAGEPDIDGRADIYSLGVLGYQMLTGEPPFDGRSFEELAAKHIADAPAPVRALAPNAPAHLGAAIERCLAKDRAHRFASGRELIDALTSRPRWRWLHRFGGARRVDR